MVNVFKITLNVFVLNVIMVRYVNLSQVYPIFLQQYRKVIRARIKNEMSITYAPSIGCFSFHFF